MGIRVFWTETALNNLEDIFEYYKYKASIKVVRDLVKGIVKTTIQIQNSPTIGKREVLLANRQFEYRFIVNKNYKIIYWIDDYYVKIAAVFDCRQNPDKIEKI